MIGLLVALAGGFGATARYVLDGFINSRRSGTYGYSNGIPVATLTINVLGSFLLGILLGSADALHADVVRIVGVGMLGGFTTFSTASVELVRLVRDERSVQAAVLAIVMIVFSILAAVLGLAIAP